MILLAHRGYWNSTIRANSVDSIICALEKGYGIESDVRDYCNELTISHDIPLENTIKAEEVFKLLCEYGNRNVFAINIKSDGLKNLLKDQIEKFRISNYFLFDMSVPQMIEYRDIGLRFFTRQSEFEKVPCLYDDAAGVWIDGFYSYDWITEKLLENHIRNRKEICIVSPELHGYEYKEFWKRLKANKNREEIMLCTDYPDEAKEFFNG